jgi:hypothetical protein
MQVFHLVFTSLRIEMYSSTTEGAETVPGAAAK